MLRNYKWFLGSLLLLVNLYGQVKLSVKTIPKKVNIMLDGINIGKSPIINDRITPGIHKFEIAKSGFAPITRISLTQWFTRHWPIVSCLPY